MTQSLLKTIIEIIEEKNGFNIEPEISVQEATTKLTQKPFDVIVSDYEMLIKNGLYFMKELNIT